MDDHRKKIISTSMAIALSAILICVLLCLVAFGYLFYWQPDPVSPPSTEFGTDPVFDNLLSGISKEWLFLFRQDGNIVLSDIYGHNSRVILDIVNATVNEKSEFLNGVSISPDNTHLAANYFSERDSGGMGQLIPKMIIVNIEKGTIKEISPSLEGFDFDWGYAAFWMSNQEILAKMHRYPGDAHSEEIRFLLYNLKDNTSPQLFEFDPCPMTTVMDNDSRVLLIASDCEPSNQLTVWAIDSDGKRVASPDEISFFDEHKWDRWHLKNTFQHPSGTFPVITISSVAGGADGFGRFYEDNWNREYMYLGDELVRVSDTFINYESEWQSGLDLFLWTEWDNTYIMDNEGHYHHMYNGIYLGRIPRNNQYND
jgi:hypothetical protein